MRSKLDYLITLSLKRKMKTKWFLITNILVAILIIGLINIDSIITLFGLIRKLNYMLLITQMKLMNFLKQNWIIHLNY